MRIAIVGPAHPYKGGSAQHTTALAHRLGAAGHEVSLHSWRRQYPKLLYPGQLTVDEPEAPLFPATEHPLDWNRPVSWWRTGQLLAAAGADAVVIALVTPVQVPAYLVLARAARARGCRVVALCHNVLPHEASRLDRPMMRAMLRSADAVIVHSPEEASRARVLADAPIEVAELPLHFPQMGMPGGSGEDYEPHRRLLFFGMVRPYKGVDVLLRALAASRADVSLTVAGEIWEGRGQIMTLISELGLTNRVTLSDGYVPAPDVAGYFAAADALVLPYRSGTASQNALIAFTFGIPVIATRAGAVADVVTPGVNGLVCDPGDIQSLTQAIDALYSPGTLAALRLGVQTPDADKSWLAYQTAVERACAPSAVITGAMLAGQAGAPPGL
jgi:glycosyltransferase involved in cell wall biosynthesis